MGDCLLWTVHPTPSEREAERSVTQPHLRRERHRQSRCRWPRPSSSTTPSRCASQSDVCILKSENCRHPSWSSWCFLPINESVPTPVFIAQLPHRFPAAQPARPNPTRCHCNDAASFPFSALVATFQHCRRCCISLGQKLVAPTLDNVPSEFGGDILCASCLALLDTGCPSWRPRLERWRPDSAVWARPGVGQLSKLDVLVFDLVMSFW